MNQHIASCLALYPPFLRVDRRRDDWGRGGENHSLSRSIRVNIEILIWSSVVLTVAYRSPQKKQFVSGSSFVYPARNKVDLINPLRNSPLEHERQLPGSARDPPGQSPLQTATHRAKSMERKKTQHGARQWICACNKPVPFSLRKYWKKDPKWRE